MDLRGDWKKLIAKIYFYRQLWTKDLAKNGNPNKIRQNQNLFDIFFCVTFDCYYPSFISGRETGH